MCRRGIAPELAQSRAATTETPRRPAGAGGARGASQLDSLSVTTTHALFAMKVQRKLRKGVCQSQRCCWKLRARECLLTASAEAVCPRRRSSNANSLRWLFCQANLQLSRDLKYIARTLLKLSFLSSSPTCPGTQSGLGRCLTAHLRGTPLGSPVKLKKAIGALIRLSLVDFVTAAKTGRRLPDSVG